MSGPDTIKGIGYQNAYTVYRLLELLDQGGQTRTVTVEGCGEDIEDLTIACADGSEEVVQVKKRETREGPYGLWGLSDVKPIVAALYQLFEAGRDIATLRFVATGSAHQRVIAIQKACQRLRGGSFAPDRDGRAVVDVRAMTGAREEQARGFMRRLWLNVPLESENHFEQAVQNHLMRACGVPPIAVVRVYNDLYKRVLDKGKEQMPWDRVVTREELLKWLEEPRDSALEESTRVEIRQRVQELRGRLLAAKVEEVTRGTIKVDQELDTVAEGGEVIGLEARQMSGVSIKSDQAVDTSAASQAGVGLRPVSDQVVEGEPRIGRQKRGRILSVRDKVRSEASTSVASALSQRVSIPSDIARRAQGFAGRLWVVSEVIEWLDNGSERFLFITGEPGCGKTALAAWLAGAGPVPDDLDNRRNLERLRDGWSAAHFCISEGKRGTLNPTRFAQSLACQLSNRYDEYAKAVFQRSAPEIRIEQEARENWGRMLGAHIDTFVVTTGAEDAYNRLVREPFEVLFAHQPGLRVLILVDALDETLACGHPNIVTLLAGSDDLPAEVRFLLTSRNEPKVLDQFRQVRCLDLSSQERASEANADIRTYVTRRMSERTIKLHGTAAGSPETIRQRLVEQAAGNFLYIQFLLDEVAAGKRSLTDLAGLPSGLFGLYCAYLDRLMPDMLQVGASQRWLKQCQPLLGCLSVAVSAVPREALPGWLQYPESEVEALLNDLAQLVEYDQDGYRLYHRSMAEFLAVREYQSNGVSKRNRYYTPPHEQHERIVCYYLSRFSKNWQACDDYGLLCLTTHLHALKDVNDYRQELYTLVESQAWTVAKYVDTPWIGSFIKDLHLASAIAVGESVEDWARSMGYQLRRALLEHLMSRVCDRAILFLSELGEVERALDFARRQRNRFKLLREIARSVASTQPAKAVEILVELAHLADDRSALERCISRLATAQDILRLTPSHSHVALDLIEEAKRLEHAISESDLIKYKVVWDLPTLALAGDLDTALAASEAFSPLQQAQALRHISSVLPKDHPARQDLIERALLILKPLEHTPEARNDRMRAIVLLLPLVEKPRQQELLRLLRSDGDHLQAVGMPEAYDGTQQWVIGQVAKVDLAWAKHMLLESDWRGALEAYAVVREIAGVDSEEALQLIKERFSNHALGSKLLVDVIGIVALEDTDKAETLIEEYAKQLRDDADDAYIAVAEAYLARGDIRKAKDIFNEHAAVPDSEGFAHARGNLQLAILARSSFLSVEIACDRLMQFPACPRCHRSRKQEAEVILARMAVRQNKLDILQQYRVGWGAQLVTAAILADCVSAEAARRHLVDHHLTSVNRVEAEKVNAHIIAMEAQQDPGKVGLLMKHYDADGKPHDFCPYMRELPYALRKLVETRKIESQKAVAIIEQLYPLLVDWECAREDQPPKAEFWKTKCDCYNYSECVLAQLIGVMALLDPDRSDEMIESLPAQPIRVYALEQILHHTKAYETMVPRIIEAGRKCIQDPRQRAESCYILATWLPTEMSGTIKHLIDLAKPLLDKSPTHYRTNRLGMRIRIGPSSTELKKCKARALMRLVSDIGQFEYAIEGIKTIDSLIQLDDKLQVLDLLAQQADGWPKEDRLTLLKRIWELSITRNLTDVQTFIAFSIPLVYSLGDEEAFWRLYEYVEWAYEGLPQVD